MGCYVNPPNNGDKLEWLRKNGETFLPTIDSFKTRPTGKLPIVLLDNGYFTAAGVAFCQKEWEVMSDPADMRPRRYFYVEESKLMKVSPLKDYLGKEW